MSQLGGFRHFSDRDAMARMHKERTLPTGQIDPLNLLHQYSKLIAEYLSSLLDELSKLQEW